MKRAGVGRVVKFCSYPSSYRPCLFCYPGMFSRCRISIASNGIDSSDFKSEQIFSNLASKDSEKRTSFPSVSLPFN